MPGARKSDDLCMVGEHCFVRGVLLIPVPGLNTDFGLGVWVSLSQKNFDRYVELYDAPGDLDEEPFFGWFCNQVPSYSETLALKTLVHLQPYPQRPLIVLEPTDHPLSVHQHHGIDVATLQQFLETVVRPA